MKKVAIIRGKTIIAYADNMHEAKEKVREAFWIASVNEPVGHFKKVFMADTAENFWERGSFNANVYIKLEEVEI